MVLKAFELQLIAIIIIIKKAFVQSVLNAFCSCILYNTSSMSLEEMVSVM